MKFIRLLKARLEKKWVRARGKSGKKRTILAVYTNNNLLQVGQKVR